MMPAPLAGIRARLALLVLLLTVPVLVLTLLSGLEHRSIAARGAEEEAQRIARLVRDQQLDLVKATRELLSSLARAQELRGGDSTRTAAFLADVQHDFGSYSVFLLADPSGAVRASSTVLSREVSLQDRDYLRRAVLTRRFAVGQYIVGRLTGQTTLPMAWPVDDGSGAVRKVLVTGLSLSWLARTAKSAGLPEGSRIVILGEDGAVLAGYPDPGRLGPIVPDPEFGRAVGGRQRRATELTGSDGVRRLYGFADLHLGPGRSYVGVGIPARAAYAGADRILAASLRNVCVVALLAIIGTWILGRRLFVAPLRNLVEAIRQVGGGDLGARSGLQGAGEIGQLAGAFDRMAEALESRQQEREALIADLRRVLAEVKTLRGFIPICACCKKIRDDRGYWNKLEAYLREHTAAEFTHGLCPECVRAYYPEHADAVLDASSEAPEPVESGGAPAARKDD